MPGKPIQPDKVETVLKELEVDTSNPSTLRTVGSFIQRSFSYIFGKCERGLVMLRADRLGTLITRPFDYRKMVVKQYPGCVGQTIISQIVFEGNFDFALILAYDRPMLISLILDDGKSQIIDVTKEVAESEQVKIYRFELLGKFSKLTVSTLDIDFHTEYIASIGTLDPKNERIVRCQRKHDLP